MTAVDKVDHLSLNELPKTFNVGVIEDYNKFDFSNYKFYVNPKFENDVTFDMKPKSKIINVTNKYIYIITEFDDFFTDIQDTNQYIVFEYNKEKKEMTMKKATEEERTEEEDKLSKDEKEKLKKELEEAAAKLPAIDIDLNKLPLEFTVGTFQTGTKVSPTFYIANDQIVFHNKGSSIIIKKEENTIKSIDEFKYTNIFMKNIQDTNQYIVFEYNKEKKEVTIKKATEEESKKEEKRRKEEKERRKEEQLKEVSKTTGSTTNTNSGGSNNATGGSTTTSAQQGVTTATGKEMSNVIIRF